MRESGAGLPMGMNPPSGARMKPHSALILVGFFVAAGPAWSQDVPLSDQDITNEIVGKKIEWTMFDGKSINVELTPGGKATVSGAYNDVGKWRMDSPGGYCITWNKASMTESCAKIKKRAG